VKIITVINDLNQVGFHLLRLSCAMNNLELIALVYNEQSFSSNRIKDDLLKNYLEHEQGDDETICFTDGFDAIFMATEEEIVTKYNQFNKDLVFSCESQCWPDVSLADQFPDPGKTPYRFLNSGGFIGKVGTIRDLLDQKVYGEENQFKKSNQYGWTKKYFKNPDKIGLDTGCKIFQTFSPEIGKSYLPGGVYQDQIPYNMFMKRWFNSNYLIQNNRIYSKISETLPCQAHFNGASKCLIDYDIINMIFGMIPSYKQPVIFMNQDSIHKNFVVS
jgi:hypothetical protein